MTRLGTVHSAALLATVVACALFAWLGRRLRGKPAALSVGRVLAALLLGAQIADPVLSAHFGRLDYRTSLPLELCDASSFALMFALWTQRQAAFELAYFWGLAGALQAILMPDFAVDVEVAEFLRFFFLHIAIVGGVFYLGPGLGLRPRPRSEWRIFGWTLVYAAAVGVINTQLGSNYMYLRRKPAGTPLDWFGPWPWYLLGAAIIAIVLYVLLALPYRFSRTRSSSR